MSWAEQLALQLRVQGARLSGSLMGPAVISVQKTLAPLSGLQAEFERLERVTSQAGPLAYCFCSVQ